MIGDSILLNGQRFTIIGIADKDSAERQPGTRCDDYKKRAFRKQLRDQP